MRTKRRLVAGLVAGLLATVVLGLLSTAGAAPEPASPESCAAAEPCEP